jgi:hypothetical protein
VKITELDKLTRGSFIRRNDRDQGEEEDVKEKRILRGV